MSLPGVSVSYGTLSIQPPLPSGNHATVSIDSSNHDVKITLNGSSEEFAPSLIANISYNGATGGGDVFTNGTSLPTLAFTYGNNNVVTAGTGYNYYYFFGNSNTFTAQGAGSVTDIFEEGGSNLTINDNAGGIVQVYNSSGTLVGHYS